MNSVAKQHIGVLVAIALLLGNLAMSAKYAMLMSDIRGEIKIFREQQSALDLEELQKLKAMESWVEAHAVATYKVSAPEQENE